MNEDIKKYIIKEIEELNNELQWLALFYRKSDKEVNHDIIQKTRNEILSKKAKLVRELNENKDCAQGRMF